MLRCCGVDGLDGGAQFSTANTCGDPDTYISKDDSAICGDWYPRGADTTAGCDCSLLPDSTDAQKILKRGCELFTAWGWKTGSPDLDWQPVACPPALVTLVGEAFKADGVQTPQAPPPGGGMHPQRFASMPLVLEPHSGHTQRTHTNTHASCGRQQHHHHQTCCRRLTRRCCRHLHRWGPRDPSRCTAACGTAHPPSRGLRAPL